VLGMGLRCEGPLARSSNKGFAMEGRQDPMGCDGRTSERRFAALKLVAPIVALELFAGSLKQEEGGARSWHWAASHIQGVTDNEGNESPTRSFMCTLYPRPVRLGELMGEMAPQEFVDLRDGLGDAVDL
jgi:hypothetical protein